MEYFSHFAVFPVHGALVAVIVWGMDYIDALVTADRNGISIIADAAGASVDALSSRG